MTVPLAPGARLRWSIVRSQVAQLRPRSILELGCGGGGFGSRLVGLTRSYTAVEPDATSWQLAHDRIAPLGGEVIHGDHTAVPDGEAYDLVAAFEVIEHIGDDSGVLADWAKLVKPGGYLMLSAPAGPERMGAWDAAVGHFRRYSPASMSALMTGAGLAKPTVRCYGWPIGYLLEGVRNRIAIRRGLGPDSEMEERTASSARQIQPRRAVTGALVAAATAPFELVQLAAPTRGVGMVALARRP